ncbi:MAG TPA: prepilin-type N-terminal cleavage/methylation domain-containing protein [Kiritimatiellia bacterium]|nr:prepilin-type N-terminal cleavage/methylation domain-containing protein [Kiritimatiellia bacterium]
MAKSQISNLKSRGFRSAAGFSLLELLSVMAIVALLSTLAVTSYFNAIRGMTRRSAVKHLANSLILARQRACLEGVRVSVMVYNEVAGYNNKGDPECVPSYVVCKEAGRVTALSGTTLVDEFTPLDKMFGTATEDDTVGSSYLGSMRLYNLTAGKWWQVTPTAVSHNLTGRKSSYIADRKYTIPAFGFKKNANVRNANDAMWEVGDVYGLEAAPPGSLPKGFKFINLDGNSDSLPENLNKVELVTFLPDGTAQKAPLTVTIRELLPPKLRGEVKVQKDGSIQYD